MQEQKTEQEERINKGDFFLEDEAPLEDDLALEEEALLDEGGEEPRRKKGRETQRRCALTRAIYPVDAMLRFVRHPAGRVIFDTKGHLPGRGVWVLAQKSKVDMALKRGLFSRAFREPTEVLENFSQEITNILSQDALQMLSVAHKAGAVRVGFNLIESGRERLVALIQASDGSEKEIQRLQGLVFGRKEERVPPKVVRCFSVEEVSTSLGRDNVIHAALIFHGVSAAFLERVARFQIFVNG